MSPRRLHLPRPWVLLALFVLSALALGSFAPAQQKPIPKGMKAGQYYKNIQVMKNVPASQVIPMMRTVAASLGVQCRFCHVIGPRGTGYEKDTRDEKRTARQMMQMVHRLNQREKLLDNEATCYLCHHGRAHPQTSPPGRRGRSSGAREDEHRH